MPKFVIIKTIMYVSFNICSSVTQFSDEETKDRIFGFSKFS